MKTRWSGRILIRCIFAFSLIMLLATAGCNDSPTDEDANQTSPLAIQEIIVTPKAPAPGDTVSLSVVISSSSLNIGDLPTYRWSISGGTLLETDKSFVKWIAPGSSQMYDVTVTASNNVNSVSHTEPVFVTNSAVLVNSGAGEIHLLQGDDAFYYLASTISAENESFTGFTISHYEMGSAMPVTSAQPGLGYVFSNQHDFAVHSYELFSELDAENAINIIIDALPSGAQTQITKDESSLANRRRNQYTGPSISPNGNLIAFQAFKAAIVLPDQGGIDTFDVHIYNKTSMQTRRIKSQYHDFYPTFSSDGQYLTFISNRDSINGWELFAFPVVGGIVDTSAAGLVRLSNTGELIATSSPPSRPMYLWNPSASHPVLAIVSGDNKLRLVGTDGTSDEVAGITGAVSSMSWSSDGTKLAVSTGDALYSVGLNRTATLLHTFDSQEIVADLTWIDSNQMILYNIQRLNSYWFGVLNVTGAVNLSVPLNVTPKYLMQGLTDYREVNSMRPLWKSNAEIYAPQFYSGTPGIIKLNLTGVFN